MLKSYLCQMYMMQESCARKKTTETGASFYSLTVHYSALFAY